MCVCVSREAGRVRGGEWLHLWPNYDFFFSLSLFLSFFQGKAFTDNCKINYGGRTDRGDADRGRREGRGVSGKHSNEKTSDFWASHCQPLFFFFFLAEGLKTHTHTRALTHTAACVCMQHAFMCWNPRKTKFHIPLIAFSISSCELLGGS